MNKKSRQVLEDLLLGDQLEDLTTFYLIVDREASIEERAYPKENFPEIYRTDPEAAEAAQIILEMTASWDKVPPHSDDWRTKPQTLIQIFGKAITRPHQWELAGIIKIYVPPHEIEEIQRENCATPDRWFRPRPDETTPTPAESVVEALYRWIEPKLVLLYERYDGVPYIGEMGSKISVIGVTGPLANRPPDITSLEAMFLDGQEYLDQTHLIKDDEQDYLLFRDWWEELEETATTAVTWSAADPVIRVEPRR